MQEAKHPFFTEEHRMLRSTLRDFMEKEVIPNGERWDQEGWLPSEVIRKMGDMGMLGLRFPEEYGGSGGDYWSAVVLIEEISRGFVNGLMSIVGVHSEIVLPALIHFGTEEQKRDFLVPGIRGEKIGALAITEPEAGSDVASIRTRADKSGDHYVINGNKIFITNGARADFVIVAAKTDREAGAHGISQFIVEKGTPGFEVARKLDKAGLRTSDTAELFFTDVKVPEDRVLGEVNRGFYQIMANFQPERLLIAISAVAGSEYALEVTLDYIKERKQFGRSVSSFQAVRHRFAEMATEVEAARELTYRACDMYNRGVDCSREVSMAKWFTTEVANRVSYGCMQLFGGYGYMMEYPIQRGWRDGRIATVVGGTTEIMKELVARSYGM
jgi:alkylation response protein AidB-like acyl-CoA dehydrogenase